MTEADRIRQGYSRGCSIPKPEPLWRKVVLGAALVVAAPIIFPVVIVSTLAAWKRQEGEVLSAISKRTGIPKHKIPESDEHGE